MGAEHERTLAAYDRLWHRCSAHQDGYTLTRHLPAPHQLRTGDTPRDLLERIDRDGTLATYNAGIPWLEHNARCMRHNIPDPSHTNLRGPILGCDCTCHDDSRPIATTGRAG